MKMTHCWYCGKAVGGAWVDEENHDHNCPVPDLVRYGDGLMFARHRDQEHREAVVNAYVAFAGLQKTKVISPRMRRLLRGLIERKSRRTRRGRR